MILCGLGIGPLPEHIAARDVDDGLLWELPPYEGIAPVNVHLIWNDQAKPNRAERAFLEYLQTALATAPARELAGEAAESPLAALTSSANL